MSNVMIIIDLKFFNKIYGKFPNLKAYHNSS